MNYLSHNCPDRIAADYAHSEALGAVLEAGLDLPVVADAPKTFSTQVEFVTRTNLLTGEQTIQTVITHL